MDALTTRAAAPALPYSTAPDTMERVLGGLSLAMLTAVALAVVRGYGHWSIVPWMVWAHLATVLLPLVLTPMILWYPRGSRRHRVFGYIWTASLAITALVSFDIRQANHGRFSFIHLISIYTLVLLVVLVRSARAHNVRRHRRTVRGLVIGALLVAGFFTFPFQRLLGDWLFGRAAAVTVSTSCPAARSCSDPRG